MDKNSSLMAKDFDEAVRAGKFRSGLDLNKIEEWVTEWCYENFDCNEYSDESISMDTEDMYKMVIDEATGLVFDEYKPFILEGETLERYQVFMETLSETAHQFTEVQNTQLFVRDELFYITFDVMTNDPSHAEDTVHFFKRYVEKYSNFCIGETKISAEDCDGETFYTAEIFA